MKIMVNGISLFYKKIGSGPPLVLLHGNGETHEIFDALSAKLAPQYTVYALDSRGHGQSEKVPDISYQAMTDDLLQFLEVLDLSPVHLVGFSDGAIVSFLLALQHPQMIMRMALLGINLSPSDFTPENYAFLQQTYEETGDPLFRLMLEEPALTLEMAAAIETPALVVAGEEDVFRPETFFNVANALPQGRLVVMQGHTHDSYVVGQDLLAPVLLDFFAKA